MKIEFHILESWLEQERDRLALFVPVGLGIGIAIWDRFWSAANISIFLLGIVTLAIFLLKKQRTSRFWQIFLLGSALIVAGFGAITLKSAWVGHPVMGKISISTFYARIEAVELISARETIRLQLETGGYDGMPPRVKVNLKPEQMHVEFVPGAIILLRARLLPPAQPALPNEYDFARRAWFAGIGANGSALGAVTLYHPSTHQPFFLSARHSLTQQIITHMPAPTGPLGAALITGDTGAITAEDNQAMRYSGMAHLVSVSGLHVSAVVGATFFLVIRLLAAFPVLALRFSVLHIAAGFAALVAIGYTLLTGAEIPTIRSCVAALVVLVALAMGREALSLRLIAFGAAFILVFWPESLAGPSFQLSFAAVVTIVALHESPFMRRFANAPSDGIVLRLRNGIVSLLITGLAIELVLAPIALFHFHKTGIYGALANLIAIPLTTFVIMPLEIIGLLADMIGAGSPFWWGASQAVAIILSMAHRIETLPGSVTMLPAMPIWAFGAIICGMLWFAIFLTKWRYLALIPVMMGLIAMVSAPRPDLLVTGDGKHLAILQKNGSLVLLRSGAGDYIKGLLQESAGLSNDPIGIEDWKGANCTEDMCIISLQKTGRDWRILATRTRYLVPALDMIAACRDVDIIISDRRLPYGCKPHWLKLDKAALGKSGGVAVHFDPPRTENVMQSSANSPWNLALADAKAKLPIMPSRYKTDIKTHIHQ